MWLWMLIGCGEPISNAVFYEDEPFLAALPSSERFEAPHAITGANVTDAVSLVSAQRAADTLDALLISLVTSGDSLRDASPSDRSPIHRSWDPRPVAVVGPAGTASWWVRGTVLLPEGGDATWSIDVAEDPDGPWQLGGTGRHATDGGELSWLPGAAPLASFDHDGTVEIAYRFEDYGRAVDIQHVDLVVTPEIEGIWQLHGSAGLAFTTDDVALLDEGARPAGMTVLQGPSGGRAQGALLHDQERIGFTECWDAAGVRTWLGGDDPVPTEGSEASCAIPAF